MNRLDMKSKSVIIKSDFLHESKVFNAYEKNVSLS